MPAPATPRARDPPCWDLSGAPVAGSDCHRHLTTSKYIAAASCTPYVYIISLIKCLKGKEGRRTGPGTVSRGRWGIRGSRPRFPISARGQILIPMSNRSVIFCGGFSPDRNKADAGKRHPMRSRLAAWKELFAERPLSSKLSSDLSTPGTTVRFARSAVLTACLCLAPPPPTGAPSLEDLLPPLRAPAVPRLEDPARFRLSVPASSSGDARSR